MLTGRTGRNEQLKKQNEQQKQENERLKKKAE